MTFLLEGYAFVGYGKYN